MSIKTSIIIPSRSAQYLKQTVQSHLDKAEGEVEVIVYMAVGGLTQTKCRLMTHGLSECIRGMMTITRHA